ncbi:MAG: hypothetical protein IPG75_17295 [Gemmatimonadetes bacterium]|nr:hypothetical protein [Gemmatimonadota bacterium]
MQSVSIVQLTTKTHCADGGSCWAWYADRHHWCGPGKNTVRATSPIKRDALWTLPILWTLAEWAAREAHRRAWREEARRGFIVLEDGTATPFVEERWARDSTGTKYAIAFLVAEGIYSGLWAAPARTHSQCTTKAMSTLRHCC